MTDSWKQWEGEVVENRYLLRRFLGGSDHSAVFVTEFGKPPRKAALKFLEANAATAQLQLSRWERAAKLSHPHLIRLLEGGHCQLGRASMLYVITEFADEDLGQILVNRPLTQAETEYMLRSVLEVLAYLHGQGLAHSRVKPGNVMAVGNTMKVSSDGICALGDKRLGHGPPTVYDPPEIATAGFSRAGDVWSLGVTLVEAVTQRPSAGEGIRLADPALPDSVPAPFLEIARQCLRLDPQRRWTVPDIAAHLLPSAPPHSKKPALTRYVGWGTAAVAVLLVLFAGSRLLDHRMTGELPAPASTAKQADLPHAQPSTTPEPVSTNPVASKTSTAVEPRGNPSEKAKDPAAAAPVPPVPAPPAAKVPVAPATSPPAPRAAKAAADSSPGAVVEQFVPRVSQSSRNTITGKVRVTVRVSVDAAGKITNETLASPGPSQYFANLALKAAKQWKFSPPRVGGEAVPSDWYLRFAFGRETTEIQPVQLTPAP